MVYPTSRGVFANGVAASAVTPSGEPTRRSRGVSDKHFWEMLLGPTPDPSQVGAAGVATDLFSRIPRAVGEGVAELGHGTIDVWKGVWDALGQTAQTEGLNNPRYDNVRNSLFGAGSAPVRTPDAGTPVADDPTNTGGEPNTGAVPSQDLLTEFQNKLAFQGQLNTMLTDPTLSEQSRVMIENFRMQNNEELLDLELELERAKQQLDVQDTWTQFQLEGLGVDLDIGPLRDAIHQEGGLGAQTMYAITQIANDVDLSNLQKEQAVDAVVARANFSSEMVSAIDEMTTNATQLQELNDMDDKQLAGALGDPLKFLDPTFKNVVVADPAERQLRNVTDSLENSELGELAASFDEQQSMALKTAIESAMSKGMDDPATTAALNQLATLTDLDYGVYRTEISKAVASAKRTEDAYALAIDENVTSLTPGSEAMTFALVEAGRQIGLDGEELELWANSPQVHAIIENKSKGRSGITGAGSIRGVGGLNEQTYEQIMGEPWSADKGMQWELQALLAYMYRLGEGDPIAALDFYRNTGAWGGVGGLAGSE